MKTDTKTSFGLLSATLLGVSSIIGSGWLFAPFNCASIAGPGAIFCWIIGMVVVSLLALCFAEVAVLYPKRGLTAIIPTMSHNKFFGFPFAIANWLGIIAVVALEADATVQYLTWLFPKSQHYFFYEQQLTLLGDGLSILLVFLYCLANYFGAKSLAKTNNPLSLLKIAIPIIVTITIMTIAFHPDNFTVINNTILPYGYKSIFTAILSTGIIIAFNGFQSIVSFASDIKKPQTIIPLSMICAILLCSVIYLALQVAFIGGVPTESLSDGWKTLAFHAPIAQLAGLIGAGALVPLIYFGATIAPSGAAVTFVGSATNMSTAMAHNQQLPKYFSKINMLYGISRRALMLNTALAVLFLFIFRSWGEIAEVLSLLHVIAYLPIPIALCVFRARIAKNEYQFRLYFGQTIAMLLFVFFTYLITTSTIKTAATIIIILGILQAVFITINVKTTQTFLTDFLAAIKQCGILLIYFIALFILIYISPNNHHILSQFLFNIITIIFAVIFFLLLIKPYTSK